MTKVKIILIYGTIPLQGANLKKRGFHFQTRWIILGHVYETYTTDITVNEKMVKDTDEQHQTGSVRKPSIPYY